MPQPSVEINNVYGFRISPANSAVKSSARETYIAHSIDNNSNTTNTITIEIKEHTPGWSAELILDENADGVRQSWEKKKLAPQLQVGEGSVIRFFLLMKRPSRAKSGDSGSAVIRVSSLFSDGPGYIGDNGLIYGGEDESEITDTVIVK